LTGFWPLSVMPPAVVLPSVLSDMGTQVRPFKESVRRLCRYDQGGALLISPTKAAH
jgi:hypothetical protein